MSFQAVPDIPDIPEAARHEYQAIRQLYLTRYDPDYPHGHLAKLREIYGLYYSAEIFQQRLNEMRQRLSGDELWIPNETDGIKLPNQWTWRETAALRSLEKNKDGPPYPYEVCAERMTRHFHPQQFRQEDIMLESQWNRVSTTPPPSVNINAWPPDMKTALRTFCWETMWQGSLARIAQMMEHRYPRSNVEFDIPTIYWVTNTMVARLEMGSEVTAQAPLGL